MIIKKLKKKLTKRINTTIMLNNLFLVFLLRISLPRLLGGSFRFTWLMSFKSKKTKSFLFNCFLIVFIINFFRTRIHRCGRFW